MSLPSDCGRHFAVLRKMEAYTVKGKTWVCLKAMQHGLFPCFSWYDIIGAFLFAWEILNIYMPYLSDKKLRHFHVPGYKSDGPTEIVVNHGQDHKNKLCSSFLIEIIRIRLLSCRTFVIIVGLIKLFSKPLHSHQIVTLTQWKIRIYIYIYRERERETDRQTDRDRERERAEQRQN